VFTSIQSSLLISALTRAAVGDFSCESLGLIFKMFMMISNGIVSGILIYGDMSLSLDQEDGVNYQVSSKPHLSFSNLAV